MLSASDGVILVVVTLIVAKWGVQLGLEWLNRRHVVAHSDRVPAGLEAVMDEETYRRSVDYTLAKGRLRQWGITLDVAVLLAVLFSGVLPWGFRTALGAWGESVWSMAGFLVITMIAIGLPSWPLDWYEQFHLEQRFGFNKTTPRVWVLDRVKSLLLSVVLGLPLFALILAVVNWAGAAWWLWAWVCVLVVQFILFLLAPVLILPLFNRFDPLPEGSLRERLLRLAERTGFQAKGIQVMDGSKRSKHSNAFFTGIGRFRKIVLFDTLIEALQESELEAVLAHEIGHYKKRHVTKMMLVSAILLLVGLYLVAWLSKQAWFYAAFGFQTESVAPALLLVGLLGGVISFWLGPLLNSLSRRHEYQADAYAKAVIGESAPLVQALRKLNEQNLSNLTPHPFYSRFYYSHPTLQEREQALTAAT